MTTHEDIAFVLRAYGDYAHGGDVERVAAEWLAAGFDSIDVDRWLDAYVRYADVAKGLAARGVRPDDIDGLRMDTVDSGDPPVTVRVLVAEAVCNNDISVERVVDLVKPA